MGNKQGKGRGNGAAQRSQTTTSRTPAAPTRNASAPPPREGMTMPSSSNGNDCKSMPEFSQSNWCLQYSL